MHLLVRGASDRAARVFFGGVASSKPAVPTTATTGLVAARHNEASLRAGTRKLKQPGVNAASVGLDIELLHQSSIIFVIIVYELHELRGATTNRLLAGLQQALADRCLGERLVDLRVEARDDRRRCSGGHQHAAPLIEHQSLTACLFQAPYLRKSPR